MELSLEIILSQRIKPSKPTPLPLKTYRLSLLDQLISLLEYRTPLVLFYTNNYNTNHQFTIVDRLKDSLSRALSLFYPLAGRLTADQSSVDCNDDGVPFIEARANCSLITFLGAINRVDLVPNFLPNHAIDDDDDKVNGLLVPMAVQVTVFDCGGIAIGSHVLHKILDGTSRAHFFRTWSAMAAGGRYGEVVVPEFTTAATLFPPVLPGTAATAARTAVVLRPLEGTARDMDDSSRRCIVRAFEFSPGGIAGLQDKARSERVARPTRVESVCGFIWKHLMAAAASAHSSKSNMSEKESIRDVYDGTIASVIILSVNMRPHIHPPLPPSSFGKYTTHAFAHCKDQNQTTFDLRDLVFELRKVILETKDVEFLSKFQGERGIEAVKQHKKKQENLKHDSNVSAYIFTVWAGLDVDFGLGLPVWIGFTGGRPSSWFKNFVVLIQTPGHGIQAWLILDELEMSILESNSEFLAFASPITGLIFPSKSSL